MLWHVQNGHTSPSITIVEERADRDDADDDDNNGNGHDGHGEESGYKNMSDQVEEDEEDDETSEDDGNWSVENSYVNCAGVIVRLLGAHAAGLCRDSDEDGRLDDSVGMNFSLDAPVKAALEPSPASAVKAKEFEVSPRAFGRTGAKADWMEKTKSFRVSCRSRRVVLPSLS